MMNMFLKFTSTVNKFELKSDFVTLSYFSNLLGYLWFAFVRNNLLAVIACFLFKFFCPYSTVTFLLAPPLCCIRVKAT